MFEKGMNSYIDGDWVNAQGNFNSAFMLKPLDSPTVFLQEYMDSMKNLAPEDWKGVRDLDKKQQIPEIENKITEMNGNAAD